MEVTISCARVCAVDAVIWALEYVHEARFDPPFEWLMGLAAIGGTEYVNAWCHR